MDWQVAVIVLGEFALAGWILYLWVSFRQKRERLRSEERLRILERFGSGQELAAFLESPAGEKFMDLFRPRRSDPHRAVKGALAAGIVLLALGRAFLASAGHGGPIQLLVPANIFQMIGVGLLLIAVAVALYELAVRRYRGERSAE